MKILWFTNTPSCYKLQEKGYNGGGWISSLERCVCKKEEVELAVSFFLDNEPFKIEQNNVVYYPISAPKQKISVLKQIIGVEIELRERSSWNKYINAFLSVVEDFKPDIIQVFGSEKHFGLIASHTKIPVVLHIQGVLNPYYNALFPPFVSWHSRFWKMAFSPMKLVRTLKNRNDWKSCCYRERELLKRVHYYFGRTDWDRRVINIMSPDSEYFYCGEILRDSFYQTYTRKLPDKLIVVSTISEALYKGMDTILRTAYILKNYCKIDDFEWKVFGNVNKKDNEQITGISADDVNVVLKGVASQENLREAELNCTLYVHPSYIDNSPNSLCEAQMLGCTCIATNIGGIPSLINDGETGILVPANDPYQIAYHISDLFVNPNKNLKIGQNARQMALKRHDKDDITNNLVELYKEISSHIV